MEEFLFGCLLRKHPLPWFVPLPQPRPPLELQRITPADSVLLNATPRIVLLEPGSRLILFLVQQPVSIQRKLNDVLLAVLWVRLSAYSAKLFAGTRHRLSGLSQPRQCGEVVFPMLVTG
jgi:hypothetical protein